MDELSEKEVLDLAIIIRGLCFEPHDFTRNSQDFLKIKFERCVTIARTLIKQHGYKL